MSSMNLKELRVSANTLASYSRAGHTMPAAMHQLAQIQPDYEKFWTSAKAASERGEAVHKTMATVWPAALVNALRAGEESGKVTDVLSQISESLNLQKTINEALSGLIYPGGVIVVALLNFLGLMVFAVPKTARTIHAENTNAITQLAVAMERFFNAYWVFLAIAISLGLLRLYTWASSPEGKEAMLDLALKVPGIREGLTDMYFGLWAKYMKMVYAAGIPTPRGFEMTATVLPPSLRAGMDLVVDDLIIRSKSLAATVDVSAMDEEDPRRDWPPFIRDAIAIGDKSGDLDDQLERFGAELVKQGLEQFKVCCKRAEILGTIGGAALAGLCFIGVYSPIVGLLSKH